MRLSLLLLLLGISAPVLAQTADPDPAPAPAPIPADDVLVDVNSARRQALIDLAFNALVDGNLPLAEHAFSEAADLPGDPAQSAVARQFAERVQQLRARRQLEPPAPRRELPRATRDSSGYTERIAVLGTTTALGLGLYGWAVPGIFKVSASESSRAFVGLYMLTASASFIFPYLLLGDAPVTAGQTNLAFYGGTRGIWQGALLAAVSNGEVGRNRRYRGWATGMMLGSVGGLVGGYHLARAANLSAGEVHTMAAVGDFGLAFGFGTGFLLHFDGQPRMCTPDSQNPACFGGPDPDADAHSRKMAAAGLVGSGLGLVSGYYLARHRNNTWGDAEVLRATAALGAWLAYGAADLDSADISFTNTSFTGGLMLGGTLGLALGDRLVRKTDFTVGQSMLIDLSMISGGLLGAGTAYLLPRSNGTRPYVFASALGSIGAFALSYWGLHDVAEGPAARRLSRLSVRDVAVIPTAGAQGERGLAVAGLF